MAVSSLLVLLDDIALVLDDVSVMAKVAAKKTAGVMGDDLALNAQQLAGISAERELPVVWAVAKGSMRNKVILVPAALVISALAPWAVMPMLMAGGAYLCFEGVEKLAHPFLHGDDHEDERHREALSQALADAKVDIVAFEKDKIGGAVRTDFILSAEIVTITLGTVAEAPLMSQVMVLSGVSLLITVGVYGLVAAIVKMDDVGLYLSQLEGRSALAAVRRIVGRGLLSAAPLMMRTLSVVGTAAMFLVGGGILLHGLPGSHEFMDAATQLVQDVPSVGHLLAFVVPVLLDALGGITAGAIVLATLTLGRKVLGFFTKG